MDELKYSVVLDRNYTKINVFVPSCKYIFAFETHNKNRDEKENKITKRTSNAQYQIKEMRFPCLHVI